VERFATALHSAPSIAADDATTISSATLQVSAGSTENDVLSLPSAVAGVSALFAPGTKTLTITAAGSASIEEFNRVLRLVTFTTKEGGPSPTFRNISLAVRASDATVSSTTDLQLRVTPLPEASWGPVTDQHSYVIAAPPSTIADAFAIENFRVSPNPPQRGAATVVSITGRPRANYR
jgi:hypothetical protein